jgi:hypothetical protein
MDKEYMQIMDASYSRAIKRRNTSNSMGASNSMDKEYM